MKATVYFSKGGDGELVRPRAPEVFEFDALPREGELIVLPKSVENQEHEFFKIRNVLHQPADPVETCVLIAMRPEQHEVNGVSEASVFTGFYTCLFENAQQLAKHGMDAVPSMISFKEEAPGAIDLDSLSWLFLISLLEAVQNKASALAFSTTDSKAVISCMMGKETREMTQLPPRVVRPLIEEIMRSALLQESGSHGVLQFLWKGQRVVVQVEETHDVLTTRLTVLGLKELQGVMLR